MTDKLREAAQLALEALEWAVEQGGGPACEHESGGAVCFCVENKAITALRAALTEQQDAQAALEAMQEPHCYTYTVNGEEYFAPPTAYVPDDARPLYTAPQPAIPPGYKLVPVEPTPEMKDVQTWDYGAFRPASEIWADMLNAAPTPPAQATLTASEILNMSPESIPAEHDGALLEYARAVIEAYERKNGIK